MALTGMPTNEQHSADRRTFISGETYSHRWHVHLDGVHVVSFFKRENAREWLRATKPSAREVADES